MGLCRARKELEKILGTRQESNPGHSVKLARVTGTRPTKTLLPNMHYDSDLILYPPLLMISTDVLPRNLYTPFA